MITFVRKFSDSFVLKISKEINISKILIKPKNYRGYEINEKYTYNKVQLSKIIDALEYYHYESTYSDSPFYKVFSITITVNEPIIDYFDLSNLDSPIENPKHFSISNLKSILNPKSFYYRWTREFKTDYGTGEHYHLMVIANNINNCQRHSKIDPFYLTNGKVKLTPLISY